MKLLGENSPSNVTNQEKFKRLLWVIVQTTVFRFSPIYFQGWRRTLLRLFGANIAPHDSFPARVWPDVDIYYPWLLSLGPGSIIGPGCRIYNLAQVDLAPGANLSRHVHVCAGSHDFSRWEMPLITAPIGFEANVWVATDCFIGPGVTIGTQSVVGARSVVMKSLPPKMLCWGHPCRPVAPRPVLS